MKNPKSYTSEQIRTLSKNFIYITQIGPLSKKELTDPDNKIISVNTYNKIYRYNESDDWCPQESTLRNIINYFNQHFYPQIGIYNLINESLCEMNFHLIEKKQSLDWYIGTYYCYYLKNTEEINLDNEYHYGIIKIYRLYDGVYACDAILGFNKDTFNNFKKKKINFNNDMSVKNIYNKYIEENCVKDKIFIYYYSGEISLLKDSIVIQLIPEKHSFLKVLTIKRYDRVSSCETYQGGIGSIMTTSYADHPVKFQSIGLSRKDIGDNIEKIKQLLSLEIKSNYIITSDDKKNNKWFNIVL